jgi:uncharacterized membrane protein YfcA
LITDANFYLAAIPAVLIFGIAKGGFGGGVVVVAVPLMALVVSPVQAAAILLPILCVMDLLALWVFRGRWRWPELRLLVPASLAGISVGTLLFEHMSPDAIRLILGVIAVTFALHWGFQHLRRAADSQTRFGPTVGVVAGATAGFTSFIAHAGSPPLSIYLLRRGMDRTAFVATAAVFFAVANYVKLVPYAWLGQLDLTNLSTSVVLSPLAPVGIAMGKWLHDRVSDRFFFGFTHVMLFVVGCKLAWDGAAGLRATGTL